MAMFAAMALLALLSVGAAVHITEDKEDLVMRPKEHQEHQEHKDKVSFKSFEFSFPDGLRGLTRRQRSLWAQKTVGIRMFGGGGKTICVEEETEFAEQAKPSGLPKLKELLEEKGAEVTDIKDEVCGKGWVEAAKEDEEQARQQMKDLLDADKERKQAMSGSASASSPSSASQANDLSEELTEGLKFYAEDPNAGSSSSSSPSGAAPPPQSASPANASFKSFEFSFPDGLRGLTRRQRSLWARKTVGIRMFGGGGKTICLEEETEFAEQAKPSGLPKLKELLEKKGAEVTDIKDEVCGKGWVEAAKEEEEQARQQMKDLLDDDKEMTSWMQKRAKERKRAMSGSASASSPSSASEANDLSEELTEGFKFYAEDPNAGSSSSSSSSGAAPPPQSASPASKASSSKSASSPQSSA